MPDQAEALSSVWTAGPTRQTDLLKARAEVGRFAGETGQAAVCPRAALRIYEAMGSVTQASRVTGVLASLAAQPGAESA